MNNIIYSKDFCPYCVMAKKLLDEKSLTYREINISHSNSPEEVLAEIASLTTRKTFPQIVLNGKHVGGYDDLCEYLLQKGA